MSGIEMKDVPAKVLTLARSWGWLDSKEADALRTALAAAERDLDTRIREATALRTDAAENEAKLAAAERRAEEAERARDEFERRVDGMKEQVTGIKGELDDALKRAEVAESVAACVATDRDDATSDADRQAARAEAAEARLREAQGEAAKLSASLALAVQERGRAWRDREQMENALRALHGMHTVHGQARCRCEWCSIVDRALRSPGDPE